MVWDGTSGGDGRFRTSMHRGCVCIVSKQVQRFAELTANVIQCHLVKSLDLEQGT